jgi:hypothetical protein
VGYTLFLQKETGRLEALVATPEKRARLPFQVIPQLTMKERCIDFTPDSLGLLQPAKSANPRKFKLQSVHKEVSVRSVEQTVAV